MKVPAGFYPRCVECHRPLADNTSVEIGLGPICRDLLATNPESSRSRDAYKRADRYRQRLADARAKEAPAPKVVTSETVKGLRRG